MLFCRLSHPSFLSSFLIKNPAIYHISDQSKNDSKANESWQTLLHRLRLLALQAYNRSLGKFEENMRNQRERRNDLNWNFCDYFLLQEELAFVYQMLGAYDEALVQYDELDALFTQFVLNSNVSGTLQFSFQTKTMRRDVVTCHQRDETVTKKALQEIDTFDKKREIYATGPP